jgi:hypothetical protein
VKFGDRHERIMNYKLLILGIDIMDYFFELMYATTVS